MRGPWRSNGGRFLAALILLAVGSGPASAGARGDDVPGAPADESREPPLSYVLEVGGARVPVEEGRAVRLEGTFTDPEVRLEVGAHRTFSYGGISFRYPRSFLFEADVSDPEAKSWTLEGNSLTVIVYRIQADVGAADLIESIAEEVGEAEPTLEPTRIELGGRAVEGLRWRAEIARQRLVYEVFPIPTPGAGTTHLLLLDLPGDDAGRSDEAGRVLPVIAEAFEVAPGA